MTVQPHGGARVCTSALKRSVALGAVFNLIGLGGCAVDTAESWEDGKNIPAGTQATRFSEPLPAAAWGHLFKELALQNDLRAWLALQQRPGLVATGMALSCEVRAHYFAHYSTHVRRTDWDASHRLECQAEGAAAQLRCQIRTEGHCVGTFGGDGRGGAGTSRRCTRGATETWAAANAVAPVLTEGGRYWSFRPAGSRQPRLFISMTEGGRATLVHESFPVGASARRPERVLLHNVNISTANPFVQVTQGNPQMNRGNPVVAEQASGVGRCGVNVAFEPAPRSTQTPRTLPAQTNTPSQPSPTTPRSRLI